MSKFISTETIHSAEVAWWWTDDKLHDDDYKIKVNDAVNKKVCEACKKYDVRNDTRYCCQWEGIRIEGCDMGSVIHAAKEVATVLSRFKDVVSLQEAAEG